MQRNPRNGPAWVHVRAAAPHTRPGALDETRQDQSAGCRDARARDRTAADEHPPAAGPASARTTARSQRHAALPDGDLALAIDLIARRLPGGRRHRPARASRSAAASNPPAPSTTLASKSIQPGLRWPVGIRGDLQRRHGKAERRAASRREQDDVGARRSECGRGDRVVARRFEDREAGRSTCARRSAAHAVTVRTPAFLHRAQRFFLERRDAASDVAGRRVLVQRLTVRGEIAPEIIEYRRGGVEDLAGNGAAATTRFPRRMPPEFQSVQHARHTPRPVRRSGRRAGSPSVRSCRPNHRI